MANNPKMFGNLPAAKKSDDGPKQTAEQARAEQPLPVMIFPKDKPTVPSVTKLWGQGEHGKAARMAIGSDKELSALLKAFPDDMALINETIATMRSK